MKRNITSLALVLFLLFSCGQQKVKQTESSPTDTAQNHTQNDSTSNASNISPPFENINVPFQKFHVDATKGGIITNALGSTIKVPANAFVDKAGLPITKEVELSYREFRNVEEILCSGIPMTYDHGDAHSHFMSTGMFELRGTTIDGEEIEIAPEQEIEVDMGSTVSNNTSDVNFYQLNQQSKWTEMHKSIRRSIVIDGKNNAKTSPKEITVNKVPVSKASKDAYKFELELNYEKFEELKDFKDIIWQYVPIEGYDNPATYEGFGNERWTSADVKSFDVSKRLYEITLKSKNKSFKSLTTPVLGEKAFAKAFAKIQHNSAATKSAINKYEKAMIESGMVSSQLASITRFGIYNHDIVMKKDQMVATKLNLTIPKSENLATTRAFLIMKKSNAIIEYKQDGYDNFDNFSFDPHDQNGLLVVFPKNKATLIKSDDFKKLKIKDGRLDINLGDAKSITSFDAVKTMIKKL